MVNAGYADITKAFALADLYAIWIKTLTEDKVLQNELIRR